MDPQGTDPDPLDPDEPPAEPEQLIDADAAYAAQPSFAEWAPLPFDASRWDEARERMEERRAAASSEALRRAVETATRAAAIDTGAIEGLYDVDRAFTVSVAMRTVGWQAAAAEKGQLVIDLFQGQLRAYELALDAAMAGTPMPEAWICRLHEVIAAPWPDREDAPGQYKRRPNHERLAGGRVRSFAPVRETAAEMARLAEQLAGPDFVAAHPVLQAAYAHHALVVIRPFQEGNGRVARALASVYLCRGASVPLLVFGDQRREYFERLAEADAGERQGLVDFVQERAADAMQLAANVMGAAVEERLAGLRTVGAAPSAVSDAELDRLGAALLDGVAAALAEEISRLPLPPGVELTVASRPAVGERAPDDAHRPLAGDGAREVVVAAGAPAAGVEAVLDVLVAGDADAPPTLRVRASGLDEALDVRLRDLRPAPTAAAHLLVDTWAARVVAALLERLLSLSLPPGGGG